MHYATILGTAALVLITTLAVSVISTLPIFRYNSRARLLHSDNGPVHCFVYLGSGGHTGEMLRLLNNYNAVFFRKDNVLDVGYSDEASLAKFKRMDFKNKENVHINYHEFLKAREVNATKTQSLKSILYTLWNSTLIILKMKISMLGKSHLILLNGPGTCCIIAVLFKVLQIVSCTPSKIVYVESLARIDSLSLTGRILYLLVDEFVVQWDELCKRYPRAKCYGILIWNVLRQKHISRYKNLFLHSLFIVT